MRVAMSERLWAIRGAAQADANDEESILAATRELVSELMARNEPRARELRLGHLHRTDDLDAQFPAVAARELGFGEVPLLCNREMQVPGAMERVIRLLAHYHAAGRPQARARLSGRDEEAPRRPPLGAMTIRTSKRLDEIPGYKAGVPAGKAPEAIAAENIAQLASNESPWGPHPDVVAAIERAAGRHEPLSGSGRDASSPAHRRAPRRRPRRDRRLERELRAAAGRRVRALRGRRRGPLRVAVVLDLPLHGAALGSARGPRAAERLLRARPGRDARARSPPRRRSSSSAIRTTRPRPTSRSPGSPSSSTPCPITCA